MCSKNVISPTFLTVSVVLFLVCLVPFSAIAENFAEHTHQPADDPSPLELQETLFEHRLQEAATKTRLVRGLAEAQNQRTFNQEQYDVQHYDLAIELFPTPEQIEGTVATTALVTGDAISTLDLNFDNNMNVIAVAAGGSPSTYSHTNDILTINLDRTYTNGETVLVSVTYNGDPAGDAFGWSSHNGNDMIWTLSEPFGARTWWPCKDLNTDKAESIDIRITVPDNGLIVASNGLLVEEIDHGSTREFHWHSDYPIVTYLVSLAIHPYTRFSDWYTPLVGDPMELQHFVYPDHFDEVQTNYALTPGMIGVFAGGYGEYPFILEKYGHAEFTWGGGMEHQTLTSMGGYSVDLISHELGHQWWGDAVTCATFHDIWLNEGFATWSEAYWREVNDDFSIYQDYMDAAAYYGPGTITVENPANFWTIFDTNLSYNKASWVVHMLRGVVGDSHFFNGLKQYQIDFAFNSATTEDLQDVFEAVSGIELDDFFQQWIYGEYFPIYESSWAQAGNELSLTISQAQTNTGLFTMPIDVRVTTDTGTYDFEVQNSLGTETYDIAVDGAVQLVEIDPDDWILCQLRTGISNPTLDQGILLVNGVDWNTYDTEIREAYEAEAFWGDNPITFWDTFNTPSGGYPTTLPTPLGHGSVPGDVIGQYSTIVWVGNKYNGDLADWAETSIPAYLELGGNVLLMTRYAQNFLAGNLTDYLGITWAEEASGSQQLGNIQAVYDGMGDIVLTGTQTYVDVFFPAVGTESTLLLQDTAGFSGIRGVGVIAEPVDGGTLRPDGAKLALICGRPYRMNHDQLRTNVEFILEGFFSEPYSPVSATPSAGITVWAQLHPVYPNPFNPQTVIPFELAAPSNVELSVYDVAGHFVRTLLSGPQAGGRQEIRWDGSDSQGRACASGKYFARLRSGEGTLNRPMMLVR